MIFSNTRAVLAVAFVAGLLALLPVFVLADELEPAVVETGAAAAVSGTENSVNFNETSSASVDPMVTETSTTKNTNESGASDVTVAATNTAESTNDTTADATTGDNVAVGGEGASVSSGTAYASGNAVNIINTNIIDANGLLLFKDFFTSLGIDLRDFDLSFFSGQPTSCLTCGGDLTVTTGNTASLTNNVMVTASTGGNTASTTDGTAAITTGNAYASGNAVNLVNTNIIRSNYLLVGINNFGSLAGDITLPNADFFKALLARNSGLSGAATVNATNTAVVANGTSALAGTGENGALGDGATVGSGTALAGATTVNQVNSSMIGGANIFFLFRIWGEWTGAVHGLPEGMQWRETPYGIEFVNDAGVATGTNSLTSECTTCSNALSVTSANTANVTNNVSVFALTGDNYAASGSGAAAIQTGDAYASANTVNVINTNIIGTNWILAIFNIFGNFSGNIAFGHPDLWLGAAAEVRSQTVPNSPVTYHFTVSNRGDADATNVRLSTDFVKEYLKFDTGSETTNGVSFNLGTIAKGDTKEFAYTALAGAVPRGSSVSVPLSATVTSTETDNNGTDNTDRLAVIIMNPRKSSEYAYTLDPFLRMVKTANTSATTTPASIDYRITIENLGGPAYNVVATDVLKGPDGKVVKTQVWNLDTIVSNEELTITYTAKFGSALPPGMYTNTMTLTGMKNYPNNMNAPYFEKVEASHTVLVTSEPQPQVLEVPEPYMLDDWTCEAYLTTYIRPGENNSQEEVMKLQKFLHNNGFGPLTLTGIYDAQSIEAVKAFQKKYNTEILSPWGYERPTGFVYITTRKMVNNLVCDGTTTFDLSAEQKAEIEVTKHLIFKLRTPIDSTIDNVIPANDDIVPLPELPPGIEVGGVPAPTPPQVVKSWSWLDFLSSLVLTAHAETSVKSVTSATASSGGQSVKSGETVTTGNASASVHTNINTNSDGGKVEVKIETEHDGVVAQEAFTKEVKKGESVSITVATTSVSKGKSAVLATATTSVNRIATSTPVERRESRVFSFFKRAFARLWWW